MFRNVETLTENAVKHTITSCLLLPLYKYEEEREGKRGEERKEKLSEKGRRGKNRGEKKRRQTKIIKKIQ